MRGWVTLTLIHPEIREYEIGWAVQPQDWGKGYATEAAQTLLKVALPASTPIASSPCASRRTAPRCA